MKLKPDTFSFDEYEKFKSSKDFEKMMSGDDLNYLASKGFEKAGVTSSDINDIMRRVDAETFKSSHLNSLLAGGIIAAAFITAFFLLMKKDAEVQTSPIAQTKRENLFILPETVIEKPADTANAKEKEITEVKWSKDHFSSKNPEQPLNAEPADENVPELENMNVNRVTSVTDNSESEINFENIPNAPVVYISGLKVTNFNVYYFKPVKQFEIVNGGREAQYIDNEDYFTKRKEARIGISKISAVDVLKEALEFFNAQKYTESVSTLNVLLKLNPKDVNALFYNGMSFYSLGKFAGAVPYFDQVLESENNIFHQEAEFYKALALNSSGEKGQAGEIFRKIVSEKGFYSARAREMLGEK